VSPRRAGAGGDGKRAGSQALKRFHPRVREWFSETLGSPSDPQQKGWPAIASGEHTLILAPTGTGKTLSAFLWELNALIVDGLKEPLPNAVQLLYISPLKALNNDIQRNLEGPLAELQQRFGAVGERFPEIRVAVRTGDTPASARARMLRKSPHILITTPESLHIMLTSVRSRTMFYGVRAVIVDEIHAIAGTKRGAHLALTLERLEQLAEKTPQRIGLSATQKPLDEIARFLGGSDRKVTIVDCGLVRKMEVSIQSPVADLGQVGGSIWPSVAPLALKAIRDNRTTIIFVNNRAQAEKMAARVNMLAGEEIALPYHGSLSRERRQSLEKQLKAGQVRALISTSALELGIDIGTIDLVMQLQSPKRVSSGLQRVGRAGHSLAAISRGVFVPTFRDDGMEMLAVARAMMEGDVEPTRVVQNALDVLAQIIVAATSVEDITSAALFELVRRAYPYHRLSRDVFDEVLEMLAGKYPSDVAAELDARITWDRTTDRLSATRASRMISVVNGGTIPDRGLYTVNLPDRTRLGELDEEFVHESRVGDVFQLGSSTWRFQSIEHDRVIVVPAPGAPARMPFWHGEYGARSAHLTRRLGELRRSLAAATTDADTEEIAAAHRSDVATARSLVEYAREQRAVTGVVPDDRTLVAEQFRDETGSVRVVLHAPFGGRVNAPWGLALAQRFREHLGSAVQVQTTDDGIMLRLPQLSGSAPMHLLHGLTPDEAAQRITAEIGDSPLFGARFRMNAGRALLLPRGNPRRRMPLWLQRLKSQDLLDAVREFPSFPILVETYRDVLQDAFDLPALRGVLGDIEQGRISVREVKTESASPMAHSLQFGFVMDWMYADDTPRAERAAALLSLDTEMLGDLLGDRADLNEDIAAALEEILAVRRGTHPDRRARTADELAILLDRAGDLTLEELRARVSDTTTGDPVAELTAARAVRLAIPVEGGTDDRFVLVESLPRYLAAFHGLTAPASAPEVFRTASLTTDAARREILARHLALSGPVSVEEVLARYAFDSAAISRQLEDWTARGKVVKGKLALKGQAPGLRWCTRRLVDHARRRALATARKQIEAVSPEAFALFMQRWQHVAPGHRLSGRDAIADSLRQLYGISRPPLAWSSEYLPARVEDFDTGALSQFGASGEVLWVGEGPHDGKAADAQLRAVRFCRRGSERAWLAPAMPSPETLSERAIAVLEILRKRGASFFVELQQASALGEHSLRDTLRELVVAGFVTNDTIEALLQVARWRPTFGGKRSEPDPTRWLPAGFTPSPDRPVVQRRVSARRLPKWRRPDKEGGEAPWLGRWSLLDREPSPMRHLDEDEARNASTVAEQWLRRYGVVTRDWWRRERPPVAWRAIYMELRRMEMRGTVRRGYFVKGLGGAQFAMPAAVEQLRAAAVDGDNAMIVIAASDPANIWSIRFMATSEFEPDTFARPRGARSLLVTRNGQAILTADSRARWVHVRPGTAPDLVTDAARALIKHVVARRSRDLTIESINFAPAATSPLSELFVRAGLRLTTSGLRYYASFDR
jgi:ATP-dependent Lhr-like helicase